MTRDDHESLYICVVCHCEQTEEDDESNSIFRRESYVVVRSKFPIVQTIHALDKPCRLEITDELDELPFPKELQRAAPNVQVLLSQNKPKQTLDATNRSALCPSTCSCAFLLSTICLNPTISRIRPCSAPRACRTGPLASPTPRPRAAARSPSARAVPTQSARRRSQIA